MTEKSEKARILLKQHFGHDSFRNGQEKIIEQLVSGRDVLGIMPTGAGKSICYQIPALLAEGITLVVSPLISLMNDQVSALIQAGIKGAYYNSSLSETQSVKALKNISMGMYKIIYVAPERLESERFVSVCRDLNISYVIVDEAHCVSQWGQDFRPSYLKIAEFVNKLPKRPTVGAFTATATDKVCDDIVKMLGLNNPYILVTGFDRPNLYFDVRSPKTMRERYKEVLEVIDRHENESGIIYCSTRKAVDEVYENLSGMGLSVTRYHAGMSNDERIISQDDFIYDRKLIIVATNAFGMGIDKSNVSFIIHFNIPKNIESYYQEAGRAGRDGSDAECVMLYMAKDIFTIRYFIENTEANENLTKEERSQIRRRDFIRLNKMVDYCNTSGCLRGFILHYFGENAPLHCDNCSSCRLLERNYIRSLKEPTNKKQKSTPKKRVNRIETKKTNELFERLRLFRIKQARIQGVPPYVIFSDKTLRDICRIMPRTRQELLEVEGIGVVKADRYGDMILKEISSVCSD